MRLNRFLAASGLCTRRQGDALIREGQIQVNGQVTQTLGLQVDPQTDTVMHQGRVLRMQPYVYVLLNKPKDCLCTTKDPAHRKTIFELVKTASTERLFSVGRLDRNTTGLILLTNDGALAQRLSHPSNEVEKVYQATLDRPFAVADAEQLLGGVGLEDGPAKPDALQIITQDGRTLRLTLHMGRNRIIHRMLEHLDYQVKKLDRLRYSVLEKKGLVQGGWRHLSHAEVQALRPLKNP